MLLMLISLIFFGAVGYFVYSASQCVAGITRLTRILNAKIFGVIGVIVYIYLVYVNQAVLLEAMKAPLA
tara:strand:- start:581 stop:787 length:207 start_codon:yes stop_codon:yes gene_type:complete